MTKISRTLRMDKRLKMPVDAVVLKTIVKLTVGNIEIKLSKVQAERVVHVLDRALAIQHTAKQGMIPLDEGVEQ